jgi:hypothetical protein
MSEEDLVGAMIGHFQPEVQNSMVYGNLKTTQDTLAFLGKIQGLENLRSQHGRQHREYDDRDANPKPWRGRIEEAANREGWGKPQTRNARYVRSQRDDTDSGRQSLRRFGRSGESSGWGRRRQEQQS